MLTITHIFGRTGRIIRSSSSPPSPSPSPSSSSSRHQRYFTSTPSRLCPLLHHPRVHHASQASGSRRPSTCSLLGFTRRGFASTFTFNRRSASSSFHQKKIESYFSAIGGESDDPPPDLTPEQVTTILRTNESLVMSNHFVATNERFIRKFESALEARGAKPARPSANSNSSDRCKAGHECEPTVHHTKREPYATIDNECVWSVEANQLASNHPTEDRLRVASLHLDGIFTGPNSGAPVSNSSSITELDQCLAFGVFDGHGGGLCADIIARRLFHYIAIALRVLEMRKHSKVVGEASVTDLSFSFSNSNLLERISTDHSRSPPKPYYNIYSMYEEDISRRLQTRIEQFELAALEQFARDELARPAECDAVDETEQISAALRRAFLQCDADLSREIEVNLLNTSSNILLHYYLSMSVSGCCTTVALLYRDHLHVASTGDCRAVMGVSKATSGPGLMRKTLKTIELSHDHNADNVAELNRVLGQHPKEEANNVIREHRLLGQLMPLRAFGDFCFKWSVDKMKQLGLTRAFGSHVIPTGYRTPPYLTAEPEVNSWNVAQEDEGHVVLDRFVILATDGLWEQFDSARKVVKAVNRYRHSVKKMIQAYTSAQLFDIEPVSDGRELTLGTIIDRLRERIQEPPVTSFERITADDDIFEDINCGTFLLRTALSDIDATVPMAVTRSNRTDLDTDNETNGGLGTEEELFSHHVDQYEQQRKRHSKLVGYLTLPQSVVRNFRDDISLIVIGLNPKPADRR